MNEDLSRSSLGVTLRDGVIANKSQPFTSAPRESFRTQAEIEAVVVKVFASIFNRGNVRSEDNFFDLGGDSLLAEQISMELNRVSGIEFPISQIFDCDSPLKIAKWILAHTAGQKKEHPHSKELSMEEGQRRGDALMPPRADRVGSERKFDGFQRVLNITKRQLWRGYKVLSPLVGRRAASAPKPSELQFGPELTRRMRMFSKDWSGTPIKSELPIFGYNLEGKKPPLFWCFNGALDGHSDVANALGSDQPFYTLRSLCRIVWRKSVTRENKRAVEKDLGKAYATELERLNPHGPFFLGGNCQGGRVAEAIARELMRRGRSVAQLSLVEHVPTTPYPGRLALFLGRESRYSSAITKAIPEAEWQRKHDEVVWDIVPGKHPEASFFTYPNLTVFAQRLKARLDEATKKYEAAERKNDGPRQ